MPAPAKALIVFLVLGCTLAAVGYGTLKVEYKPYGVPDQLRPKYEAMLAANEAKLETLKQAKETGAARISIDDKTHDFGIVDPHATLSHAFRASNVGKSPLSLKVVSTSCKCTVGNLKDNVLLPGESTTITMTWNTGYKSEKYQQTAILETNDPTSPTVEVQVSGEVKAELVLPDSVHLSTSDPGEPAKGFIAIYSQLYDSFSIVDATSDLPGFSWEAEPMKLDHGSLRDREPTSAMLLRVHSVGNARGKFSGEIEVDVLAPGAKQPVSHTIKASGKVRAPINFYSNQIDSRTGLEVGTLISGKRHDFKLIVRARGKDTAGRDFKVLDVKPEGLEASLKKLSRPGDYRLTVTVPADCEPVQFNRDEKHGYVEVGDPDDDSYSNWFPVMGAVVELAQ